MSHLCTTAGPSPNNGKADTTDHDPIHPLKHAAPGELDADEAKVYEIVVRSFLACLSRNAKGHESTVTIDIAGEAFTAKGLQILDRGFLEVDIVSMLVFPSLFQAHSLSTPLLFW